MTIAMEGAERICPHCREPRSTALFQYRKGRPNGWCQPCRKEAQRKSARARGVKEKVFSRIDGDQKLCMECHQMVPLSDFHSSRRGLGGIAAYCKKCVGLRRLKQPNAKEKKREQVARWRKENRERHLAYHRIRMFERRHRLEVSADGTVTVDFLRALYRTETCHYCKRNVAPDERTADHVVPLIREGAHSAANLVMACRSCNSSKRDLSAEDFLERLRKT